MGQRLPPAGGPGGPVGASPTPGCVSPPPPPSLWEPLLGIESFTPPQTPVEAGGNRPSVPPTLTGTGCPGYPAGRGSPRAGPPSRSPPACPRRWERPRPLPAPPAPGLEAAGPGRPAKAGTGASTPSPRAGPGGLGPPERIPPPPPPRPAAESGTPPPPRHRKSLLMNGPPRAAGAPRPPLARLIPAPARGDLQRPGPMNDSPGN
ncbi:uncharacterized protein LOC135997899 [Caloenas nicobarica]|uniref:uncharacterized protein LOC135997899 n=1 Tax=Caloenas nicobarica TaxID=187106 RepID=UPI0032B7CA9E